MKKSSGIDSLLDALRQSGVEFNQDNPFGGKEDDASTGGGGDGPREPRARMEIPFADRMATWGKRALIILAIAIVLLGLAAYWWFHPPINIHSTDTWTFVIIFILLPIFLVFWSRSHAYRKGTAKLTQSDARANRFRVLSYLPIAVVLVAAIGAIASFAFFPGNADKYANILQTDDLEFAEDIVEVNYLEIPVIDRDSAALLGNRTLGNIPEYVSQFEISTIYSQINYNGTPTRVSPLLFADIFKWWNNREEGLPAYVLVDMTTQNTEIVRLENGIHYSESEPLMRNLDRHVQLSFPFYMFEEKSFEIDEEGNPWWICPVQTRTIGLFGGKTISRVVLCDAVTGECQDLEIEEVPEWVDRVYPADVLVEQYNWSGAYQDGWINSWLGQQGVKQTTPGTNGQSGYNYIAKDDDVWMYTGVTSATSDNSIIGFVLVNQRTAESHFYSVAGATEESAMRSAEGQVQHLGYSATFPLLINIAGQPTYFMALKDNAGLVKQFAMLDIQRYQNVAVADTVAQTQEIYEALLITNGLAEPSDDIKLNSLKAEGVISHMVQAVVDGNSHFYIKLDGEDKVYDFALPALLAIVGYAEGDTISFNYIEGVSTFTVETIDGHEVEQIDEGVGQPMNDSLLDGDGVENLDNDTV